DTGNLVTKTMRFWDANNTNTFGRLSWQVLPDGTASIYTYYINGSGVLTNIIVQRGQPGASFPPTSITDGMQTSTQLNSLGQPTLVQNKVITNGALGAVLSQSTYTYSGNLNQNLTLVDLANRTNQYNYACCGLDSTVDPDGVTTTYDYDGIKRQV